MYSHTQSTIKFSAEVSVIFLLCNLQKKAPHKMENQYQYEHLKTTQQTFLSSSVQWLQNEILSAMAKKGTCILGLSGGSTPGPIYEEVGKLTGIDWSKVYVFAVDERYTPPTDKDSNRNLVGRTLLKHSSIPKENIFFPNTTLPLEDCLAEYEKQLQTLFSSRGLPDIITLGMFFRCYE
jgi:6-phosphogluconolactonase